MFTKQVVLVAGFDMNQQGINFSQMCSVRMRQLTKKFPKEKLKFTIFDFANGTVKNYEIDEKSKKTVVTDTTHTITEKNPQYPLNSNDETIEKVIPYEFVALSGKNYTNWDDKSAGHDFKSGQEDLKIISILDIYDFVQTIGKGPDAGSLIELSFFTHGYELGPVPVNSYDLNITSDDRDKNDRDPRPGKDFKPPTMDAAKLANFQKAFDPNALIWEWGCSFPVEFNPILSAILNSSLFKSKATVADGDVFKLRFELDKARSNGAEIFDAVQKGLAGFGKLTKPTVFDVQMTMADVKTFFKAAMDSTYHQAIATAAKVKDIAAFTGTYADPFDGVMGVIQDKDAAVWKSAEQKLHDANPRHKIEPFHSFSRSIKFYEKYLGRSKDPENRGYAIFPP